MGAVYVGSNAEASDDPIQVYVIGTARLPGEVTVKNSRDSRVAWRVQRVNDIMQVGWFRLMQEIVSNGNNFELYALEPIKLCESQSDV